MIRSVMACVALLAIPPVGTRAQQVPPAPPSIPPAALQPPVLDEVSLVAQGWLLLSQGSAVPAAARARDALQRAPSYGGAVTLLIEAELLRGGTGSGLAEYERWLGARTLEEPLLLRRIARAALREDAKSADAAVKAAALGALAEDGDTAAAEELSKAMKAGDPAATRALAQNGNAAAVRALIDKLNAGSTDPLGTFDVLAHTRSRQAISAVRERLRDRRPEVRGSAAEALGKMDAKAAAEELRALTKDENGFVSGRAALALARLGDSDGLAYAQELARGTSAPGRLIAADAMSANPNPAWVELVRGLTSASEPEVRLGAARLIAPVDPALAESVVSSFQNSENPALRDLAADTTVAVARRSRDLRRLRALLHSPNPSERVGAATEILALTR
ncbi:MAG TPA: HEAT repeat domain-containing protein [Vicinamibacterales bacterium]|nr:HEAT repeat domain-containing protein [Vicinamibacterales bacterium]